MGEWRPGQFLFVEVFATEETRRQAMTAGCSLFPPAADGVTATGLDFEWLADPPRDSRGLYVHTHTQEPFRFENNTVPVSVAFVGTDRSIISIRDLPAYNTEVLYSPAPYIRVLVTNAGWFQQRGYLVGTPTKLAGCEE